MPGRSELDLKPRCFGTMPRSPVVTLSKVPKLVFSKRSCYILQHLKIICFISKTKYFFSQENENKSVKCGEKLILSHTVAGNYK